MADQNIRVPDWSIRDKQSNSTFSLSLFNGNIYVKVRSMDRAQTAPLFNKKLQVKHLLYVEKVIQKIMSGSPEQKMAVKLQTFDPQSKQWRMDWVMTFEKDSKMCYRVHLTDATSGRNFVFAIRGAQDISIGAEVMPDSDRSSIMLTDLALWLKEARHWAPATIQPFDPNKKKAWGGNGGGQKSFGGGYSGGNNSAPQAAPMDTAPSGDDNGGLPF